MRSVGRATAHRVKRAHPLDSNYVMRWTIIVHIHRHHATRLLLPLAVLLITEEWEGGGDP